MIDVLFFLCILLLVPIVVISYTFGFLIFYFIFKFSKMLNKLKKGVIDG
jgi:hypothetical protein